MTALTALRVNVGAGDYPLSGWLNIDNARESAADMRMTVPPLPFCDAEVDEIYAGHFLEHLDYDTGQEFLRECYRVLRPGGTLGIVVPDTREIMRRYLGNMGDYGQHADGRIFRVNDLDDVCAYWLFSTVQPSRHQWAYDMDTLRRAMERNGFTVVAEIDRLHDPRLSTGQWYQGGWQSIKPISVSTRGQ
jgi:predicted SAM-dependent methyltransferase